MHKAWEGVRDASSYGNRCLSNGILGIFAGGDEDCLFLNVYSPDLRGNYPVMFWYVLKILLSVVTRVRSQPSLREAKWVGKICGGTI